MSGGWCWRVRPSQRLRLRGAAGGFRPEAGAGPKLGRGGPPPPWLRTLCFWGDHRLWPGICLYWKILKRFEVRVGVPQRGLGAARHMGRKLRVPEYIKAHL